MGEVALKILFGGITAAVAAAIHKYETEKREAEYNRGKEDGKNESNSQNTINENEDRQRQQRYAEEHKKAKDYEAYENLTLALYAISIAVANCDGEIASCEKEVISDIVSGLTAKNIPKYIYDEVSQMFYEPPTFNTAMEYVSKVPTELWWKFNEAIDHTIEADEVIDEHERAFKEAWKRLYDEICIHSKESTTSSISQDIIDYYHSYYLQEDSLNHYGME